MQHAFAGGAFTRGFMNDTERRALALSGAGDIVFDWDVVSDKIFVSPEVEHQLGLKRGSLEGPASAWLDLIHPFDRDRYRAVPRRGDRAAPRPPVAGFPPALRLGRASLVPPQGASGRSAPTARCIRIVGTLADVTDSKTAEERLLHDAVHDNLTSLPNRQLFYDRLEAALTFAEPGRCPAPHRARHRSRQVQADQRRGRAMRRAIRSCSPCRAA